MRWPVLLIITSIGLSLIGCTSVLKKQCQDTNWYQYAHDVAGSGRRLSQDNFIKSCEKEEVEINSAELDRGFKSGMAHYCTAESAFKTGKSGALLTEDFCSSSELPALRKKHSEGLAVYCSKDGMYETGVQGNVYSGNCAKELESHNLSDYKRGRKKFLEFTITQNKTKLRELSEEQYQLTTQLNIASRQLSSLPLPRTYYNEQTKMKETIDPFSGERSNINSQIDRINLKLRKVDNEMEDIKSATYKMESELNTLN